MSSRLLLGGFVGLLAASVAATQERVEVVLAATLDEPRGFCLDTVGHQRRARLQAGLQTHTCYSYQGQLGVDQAFDKSRVAEGVFYLIEFDVCMTLASASVGSRLALKPCDGSALQQFEYGDDGKIRPTELAGTCVTVGEGPSREGGGGRPVHLIRNLNVKQCVAGAAPLQTWRLRKSADEKKP